MVGSIAVFNYPQEFKTLPEYTAHAGKQVRVLRELSEKESDHRLDPEMETMYEVQSIVDKWIGHAFESELEVIARN